MDPLKDDFLMLECTRLEGFGTSMGRGKVTKTLKTVGRERERERERERGRERERERQGRFGTTSRAPVAAASTNWPPIKNHASDM